MNIQVENVEKIELEKQALVDAGYTCTLKVISAREAVPPSQNENDMIYLVVSGELVFGYKNVIMNLEKGDKFLLPSNLIYWARNDSNTRVTVFKAKK